MLPNSKNAGGGAQTQKGLLIEDDGKRMSSWFNGWSVVRVENSSTQARGPHMLIMIGEIQSYIIFNSMPLLCSFMHVL